MHHNIFCKGILATKRPKSKLAITHVKNFDLHCFNCYYMFINVSFQNYIFPPKHKTFEKFLKNTEALSSTSLITMFNTNLFFWFWLGIYLRIIWNVVYQIKTELFRNFVIALGNILLTFLNVKFLNTIVYKYTSKIPTFSFLQTL